jgi:hypothetical protein
VYARETVIVQPLDIAFSFGYIIWWYSYFERQMIYDKIVIKSCTEGWEENIEYI